MDTDRDGLVSFDEFSSMLARLGVLESLSSDDCTRLFQAIDANHTGSIDYAEFLSAFRIKVAGRGSHTARVLGWETAVVEKVGAWCARCSVHSFHMLSLVSPVVCTVVVARFQTRVSNV